jgi:FlaA1/EpsC-like NDP-sugar epimerase
MGSRGSIIPFFRKLADKGEIPITDERMTRFMISLDQAVNMVWHAMLNCSGGEIFVKKCPSMKIMDIANAIAPDAKISKIGIRPGEKLHEQMISVEDARTTFEFDDHFTIVSPVVPVAFEEMKRMGGKLCDDGFAYTSDSNDWWMKQEELSSWIAKEYEYNSVR